MKKMIMIFAGMMLGTVLAFAQDISASEVPSVVLNSFQKEFSKATDIEWELKGDLYDVEFDIGFADHEVWLDNTGKIVKHEAEIKENDLPGEVSTALKKEYSAYRISDIKKIQTGSTTTYELDVKNGREEWELTLDVHGKVLNKKAD